ncbi:MAG: STAS domain-containing protein [Planctomycetota bacterium]
MAAFQSASIRTKLWAVVLFLGLIALLMGGIGVVSLSRVRSSLNIASQTINSGAGRMERQMRSAIHYNEISQRIEDAGNIEAIDDIRKRNAEFANGEASRTNTSGETIQTLTDRNIETKRALIESDQALSSNLKSVNGVLEKIRALAIELSDQIEYDSAMNIEKTIEIMSDSDADRKGDLIRLSDRVFNEIDEIKTSLYLWQLCNTVAINMKDASNSLGSETAIFYNSSAEEAINVLHQYGQGFIRHKGGNALISSIVQLRGLVGDFKKLKQENISIKETSEQLHTALRDKIQILNADVQSDIGIVQTETTSALQTMTSSSSFWMAAELILMPIGILLASIIAYLIISRIIGALISLTSVASKLKDGDLDIAISARGGDEIGALAVVFDQMRNSIRQRIKELNSENEIRKESEKTLQNKLDIITRQQEAIRSMTTPAIEVGDRLLALPIVGFLDSQRAAEMTQNLLAKIVESEARGVIIDITAIDVIDTQTADHFIKMAKSARLLGAKTIITGISPTIALTLTHIDVNLSGIIAMRNLREGIEFFLAEQGRTIRERDVTGSQDVPSGLSLDELISDGETG